MNCAEKLLEPTIKVTKTQENITDKRDKRPALSKQMTTRL